MMTTEISTAREQQLFNGKNFHVVIYNKTESVSGLHQHDYYEYTIVLTGRYYQVINGKRVLLERGDFVFIPMGSHHQSFYEFGATRILNVGISKSFFEKHYLPLLPFGLVASQVYAVKSTFLSYIESVIASLNFRETEFDEFIELVSFYTLNRLRHYREEPTEDVIPQWLKNTVEGMHDKLKFGEGALENMVELLECFNKQTWATVPRLIGDIGHRVVGYLQLFFGEVDANIINHLHRRFGVITLGCPG